MWKITDHFQHETWQKVHTEYLQATYRDPVSFWTQKINICDSFSSRQSLQNYNLVY